MPHAAMSANVSSTEIRLRVLRTLDATQIEALAHVLQDCVEGGASVGFMSPFTIDDARAFWTRIAESVHRGERILLIAEDQSGVIGTVQLVIDMPPNQPHRADVAKMLVHRRARNRGVGAALMHEIELLAIEAKRSLLVLDTVTDSAGARLYARMGWQRVGDIPNYAMLPDGIPCSTTYYYRQLNLPLLAEATA
jgi:GNAT superfamily N-acetyltransferase